MDYYEYRGFRAKIDFDMEDDIYIGEVVDIDDSLNFHGNTEDEAVKMFHRSINNYIKLCEAFGKQIN